jgi:hypothetical protein
MRAPYARAFLPFLALIACGQPDLDADSGLTATPSSVDGLTDSGSPAPGPRSDASGSSNSANGSNGNTDFDASHVDGGAMDAAKPVDAARVTDAAGAPSDASAGADAAPEEAGASAPIAKPGEFHCVNWADARDNYVDGPLQLSGLDSKTDTYASVQTKATQILAEFREKLGANTIRIPINEPTVSGAWWDSYKAIIDAAAAQEMNVIVAYWAHQNGKVDDEAAFKAMWQKVVAAYAANDRVFFDIHNEPYGYSASWNDEAARWLGYFPTLPRARVIVAGTGYDDNLVPVGADARFAGCILQLHFYAFWHQDWNTRAQWTDSLKKSLGAYSSRTFIGEWGATMSSGANYNTSTPDGDNALSYISATADYLRANHMGSCYWPGLRDGDGYTLMKRDPNKTPITLTTVSSTGRDRLRWAWSL